jgi:hypothetical protein
MSCINETFIIEPIFITGDTPTLSACTTLFSNQIVSCSGDTVINMGTGVIMFNGNIYTNDDFSATTINASTYLSGGTNILNIVNSKSISAGTFNSITETLTLYNGIGTIIVTGFTDYYVTGGTYSNGIATFTNNYGGVFTVSGFDTANQHITGFTYDNNNTFAITDNSGNTFSVTADIFSGITATSISATTYSGLPLDVYVTGGTFNSVTKVLTYTRNDDNEINVILPFRLFNHTTASTSGNVYLLIDTVTGITNNSFIVSYVTAYDDNNNYGFWKRTLAVNNFGGFVTIIGENSDFDRESSGMTPNCVVYSANGETVSINISGETAINYNWSSNWEIIF